ncbi:hypothetical protein IFM89_014400 [Coptis chinensis]|uniref:Uncharacterized protein n=1 Tax=Coptis chinensis TaxID=261450 RepID=A0A835GXG8_9MAGN|nr:hypothetical protein IFM89_014400 [Coptis chinensis]
MAKTLRKRLKGLMPAFDIHSNLKNQITHLTNPGLFYANKERINEDMSANSGSLMTITDDDVTRVCKLGCQYCIKCLRYIVSKMKCVWIQVVGKDSRGRCRVMGPRVNKTSMKRMEPVLDQNYHLAEENKPNEFCYAIRRD